MTYTFTPVLQQDISQKPVLISGQESAALERVEYLVVKQENIIIPYEIRFEYSCSPFREALIANHVLAVGFEEYFYLFDLTRNENILRLQVDGYFGHLYFYQDLFYIADACGLHCVNKFGEILWQNLTLAVDGVLIEKFDGNKIYGEAELDPPGGWENFVLNLSTGKLEK